MSCRMETSVCLMSSFERQTAVGSDIDILSGSVFGLVEARFILSGCSVWLRLGLY